MTMNRSDWKAFRSNFEGTATTVFVFGRMSGVQDMEKEPRVPFSMSELSLPEAFALLQIEPTLRDPDKLRKLRKQTLKQHHPDKCGGTKSEEFIRIFAAFEKVLLYFKDVEDCEAAGVPYRGESPYPHHQPKGVASKTNKCSNKTRNDRQTHYVPARDQGFVERYWFEEAFEELTPTERVLREVGEMIDPEVGDTWTSERNERFQALFDRLKPLKPMRGAPREIEDHALVWIPRDKSPPRELNATSLVKEQDRLRQPRAHLWHNGGGRGLGVSAHRMVEEYMTTNLLAEEINHDFGVFQTPTHRSTARAHTDRRKDHQSTLFVLTARQAKAREEALRLRKDGVVTVAPPEDSLEDLYADTAGFAAHQEAKERLAELRQQQYQTRVTMEAQMRAVMQKRMDVAREQTLFEQAEVVPT